MTTTKITLSSKPCVHNGEISPGVPKYPNAHKKANSYLCPVGPLAGRAWVLMVRADWDEISSNASHTLRFAGSRASASIGPLYVVEANRLLAGATDDANAVMLIELEDKRGLLARFTDTGGESYYIRSFANAQPYLTGTFQASWNSLLSDLWGNISTLAGSWPGLPAGYSPVGTPEGFQFAGVNAWRAVHEVLAVIGLTTAYNPLTDSFSVVRIGATQTTATLPTPIFDAEPESGIALDVPATVRVYFSDHYESYGQERDTELATNWAQKPPFDSDDVATSVTGAITGTVAPIWSNLSRVLDEDNSDDNSAERASVAAQVAANFLLDAQTPRTYKQFEGVLTDALPGSQIKAVMWRHWGPELGGTVTEILQHPGVPVSIDQTSRGPACCMKGLGENVAPPDIGRGTFPNYPRIANIVRVYDSGSAFGAVVSPNASGLHDAKVRRWVGGSMAELDPCWLLLVDDFDTEAGQVAAINGHYYGPARLSGLETDSSDQRAIYLATTGKPHPKNVSQ